MSEDTFLIAFYLLSGFPLPLNIWPRPGRSVAGGSLQMFPSLQPSPGSLESGSHECLICAAPVESRGPICIMIVWTGARLCSWRGGRPNAGTHAHRKSVDCLKCGLQRYDEGNYFMKSCRNKDIADFFFFSLYISAESFSFHPTPVAKNVLICPPPPPPTPFPSPLVPPTPSSTHAVIQWKISAVNLSTYGFTIVATLWTPSFCCPAVWKADVQKLNSWLDCILFSFLIYLWKAVCLLSFPFRYSAKPDLMCFFFMGHKATFRRPTVDESDDQWDDSVSVVIWAVFYNVFGLSWMDGWILRTLKCPMIYTRPLRSSNTNNG